MITKMEIKTSLDWVRVESDLHRKSRNFSHHRDTALLINNIRKKVTELSKAEVDSRRGFSSRADTLLLEINNDIELIEGYILVSALIG
jgi:hypothetical protein